jgi:hypothetical protein
VRCTLKDPRLAGVSGLAIRGDVLYAASDQGPPRLVTIDSSCRPGADITIKIPPPTDAVVLLPDRDTDVEDLASGPDGAIWLADIGGNRARRLGVSLFRWNGVGTTVTRYDLRYPDGPHDAEALLVDADGRIMVATKEFAGAALYRAPRRLVTEDQGTNVLTRLADVPALVTDGAYLPDGRFVLRTYTSVYLYDRPGHVVARASLPPQPQGESVAADGDRLLVGSEGVRSTVLAVPVPGPSPAASSAVPSPTVSPTPSTAAPEAGGDGNSAVTWVLGALGVVVLIGVVAVARRRQATGSIR